MATGRARTLLSPVALGDLLGGREGWISDVVSVEGDGSRIVATVASKPPDPSSNRFHRSGHTARFALYDIDLREITRLSSPFL